MNLFKKNYWAPIRLGTVLVLGLEGREKKVSRRTPQKDRGSKALAQV